MSRARGESPLQVRALVRQVVLYWVRTGHRDVLSRDLGPLIRPLRGVVLDIGGGRPAYHDRAWHSAVRRIRVDISPKLRPHVVGDAGALPFRSESVDAVVMCELLEHLAEPRRTVAEAYRALRDGGVVVGSVPFIMPVHNDPSDYYRYTADGLNLLLRPFSTVKVVPHGNHLGAAWRLITARYRAFMIFNPVFRLASRGRDAHCPEGYTFFAVK
jgi:SAM-dependent methyltransferase